MSVDASQSPHPLAVARFHARLTQRELGELAGVNRATIGYIERGGLPQVRTASMIARALGEGLDDLFPTPRPAATHITTNDDGAPDQDAVEAFKEGNPSAQNSQAV